MLSFPQEAEDKTPYILFRERRHAVPLARAHRLLSDRAALAFRSAYALVLLS